MKKITDINPFKNRPYRPDTEEKFIDEKPKFKMPKNFDLIYSLKIVALLVAVLFGLAALPKFYHLIRGNQSLNFPPLDDNKWQVVFLNNNLFYFGHLEEASKDYVSLKNVYYFKTVSTQQNNFNLIKLTNEIYSPEDSMYLPKNQLLFWQNLKDDSQVVKLISQQEAKK